MLGIEACTTIPDDTYTIFKELGKGVLVILRSKVLSGCHPLSCDSLVIYNLVIHLLIQELAEGTWGQLLLLSESLKGSY